MMPKEKEKDFSAYTDPYTVATTLGMLSPAAPLVAPLAALNIPRVIGNTAAQELDDTPSMGAITLDSAKRAQNSTLVPVRRYRLADTLAIEKTGDA